MPKEETGVPARTRLDVYDSYLLLLTSYFLLLEHEVFVKLAVLESGLMMCRMNPLQDHPPGKLIAVEGLDGSGKSTQIYLLKRWLELQGMRVFFTEWNSSVLVKKATSKAKKRNLLTATTFSLIHATDFADRYEREIVPLLRAGYIVLADRYIFTAFARDVVRGNDPLWVRSIYSFAVKPDLTFFFKAPLETSLSRILDGRPTLKYHEAGLDMGWTIDPYESFRIFQGKIFEQYLGMEKEFEFIPMEATGTIESQQQQVRNIVSERIDLQRYKTLRRQ